MEPEWFPSSSGFVGPFEPTRAFPGGAKRAHGGYHCPLPWAQALDKAEVPADRTTELWLLDGMNKSWASYEPTRLPRGQEEAATSLQWGKSLRTVSLEEMERVLGFASGHTAPAVPSGSLKTALASRRRQQLLERSSLPRALWPAVQTAVQALHHSWGKMDLCTFLRREMTNCHLVNPILGGRAEGAGPCQKALSQEEVEAKLWCPGQRLVLRHMSALSSKGSDVRLSTGALIAPGAGRVQSVQSNLWRWRSAFK